LQFLPLGSTGIQVFGVNFHVPPPRGTPLQRFQKIQMKQRWVKTAKCRLSTNKALFIENDRTQTWNINRNVHMDGHSLVPILMILNNCNAPLQPIQLFPGPPWTETHTIYGKDSLKSV